MLKELGFIRSKTPADANQEWVLYVELWKQLEGDENLGVNVESLGLFCEAILGIAFS